MFVFICGGRVRARNGAPVCSDFRNGAESLFLGHIYCDI